MTHLTLFLSAFATVFLLGIQQKNVIGNHYAAAIITSIGIGSAQIFLWKLIPQADAGKVIDAAMITEFLALQSCSPAAKEEMRAVLEKWESFRVKMEAARRMQVAA